MAYDDINNESLFVVRPSQTSSALPFRFRFVKKYVIDL